MAVSQWNVPRAAVLGAICGIGLGLLRGWPIEVVSSFIVQVIGDGIGGAVLFGLVTVLLNHARRA